MNTKFFMTVGCSSVPPHCWFSWKYWDHFASPSF